MAFWNRHLVHFIVLMAVSCASLNLHATEKSQMKLGMYVVVDDMPTAKAFYTQVFEREASVDYGDFVSFQITGGIFALFSKNAFTHQLSRGNNSVPYLQVSNINREFKRIRQFAPRMINTEIVDEGPIKLFMFADHSGNVIEFYSLAP